MFKWYTNGVRKKGVVTGDYPHQPYEPYDGSMGMPEVDVHTCRMDHTCVEACPTGAIDAGYNTITVDMGKCIFCGECARHCPEKSLKMSKKFERASKDSEDLKVVYRIDRRKQ
jgi:hydrogenase-4 component H